MDYDRLLCCCDKAEINKKMLKNPFGYMMYLLLRNDIGWGLLSEQERQSVIAANKVYNVKRDDYANPQMYGSVRCDGGENWDNFRLNSDDVRMNALLQVLDSLKPARVLEIGPGAGFYTRCICEHSSVREYTAVDIGQAFLDYLSPRLEKIKERKDFKYNLISGEITEINLADKFDLVILLSTVHHIPNRTELFKKLADMLTDSGVIFCFDPSHYLPRILGLIKKFIFNGYLRKEFYSKNISTHHMCSYGEYKRITKRIGNLKIEKTFYKLPERIKRFKWLLPSGMLFSNEIGIMLKKA
jgi:SAM-dependent methyltransferase